MTLSALTLKLRIESLARSSNKGVFGVSPKDYGLLVKCGVINADGKMLESNVRIKMSRNVPVGTVKTLNVTLN